MLGSGDGLYEVETAAGAGGGAPTRWRWTDGNARLELPEELRRAGILLLGIVIEAAQPSWQLQRRPRRRRAAG